MARLHLLVCLLAVSLTALSAAPMADDAPTTAAPTTPPTTPEDPKCKSECPANKAGSVPNLCNCQKYFVCDKKGQATPAKCMPWENFDLRSRGCVFWSRADCSAVNLPTMPPPTTEPPVVPGCDFEPQCPATGSSKMGVPCKESCKIFIECENGKWSKKSCPIFKPWFDIASGNCVLWGGKCAEDA